MTPSGAYEFSLDGASFQANPTFAGLVAGDYTFTVRNVEAGGCATTAAISITEPAVLVAMIDSPTNTTCGNANGALTASVSGGAGAYTYAWSNGATSATTGLAAGSYSVTVTDANGCTAEASATVAPSDAIGIEVVSTTPATCGTADGAFEVEAFGATAPVSYRLGATGASRSSGTFAGLAAGAYAITATGADGCAATQTVTVPQAGGAGFAAAVTLVDAVECAGDATASVRVDVTPSGTYEFSLDGASFQTNPTFAGLAAGDYTFTVRNAGAGGCATTAAISIGEPAVLVATINTPTNTTCGDANGALAASATGGAGTYTYAWASGATSATLTGLAAGTYTVTVTDANGCTAEASATVAPSDAIGIEVVSTTAATCGTAHGALEVEAFDATAPVSYRLGATGGEPELRDLCGPRRRRVFGHGHGSRWLLRHTDRYGPAGRGRGLRGRGYPRRRGRVRGRRHGERPRRRDAEWGVRVLPRRRDLPGEPDLRRAHRRGLHLHGAQS